jgi:triosephosphate isomerase
MKYVLSSWKMYPTVDEARSLTADIQTRLLERLDSGASLPDVILCPPSLALVPLREIADDRVLHLGAQTCHWEDEGNYTGEISPRMLEGLVEYVLVGHSERREMGETDEQVARKVAAVSRHGMTPILLVGEDDKGEDAIRRTEDRLRQGLSEIDVTAQEVLVVYEPTWAIGQDERAPADHIRRSVEHLRGVLDELGAREPGILYGGTVNEENVDELAGLDVLDGVGAGRASLDAERFLEIIDRAAGG